MEKDADAGAPAEEESCLLGSDDDLLLDDVLPPRAAAAAEAAPAKADPDSDDATLLPSQRMFKYVKKAAAAKKKKEKAARRAASSDEDASSSSSSAPKPAARRLKKLFQKSVREGEAKRKRSASREASSADDKAAPAPKKARVEPTPAAAGEGDAGEADLDAYLKELEERDVAIALSTEPDDAAPKKKRVLHLPTFDADDYDADDDGAGAGKQKPKKGAAPSGGGDPMDVVDPDAAQAGTDALPKNPPRLVRHENWPVLAGDNEAFTLRCTYASPYKGPFQVVKKGEGETAVFPDAIANTAWGIFAHHGYRPDTKKAAKGPDDDADLAAEAPAAPEAGLDNDDVIDADGGNTEGLYIHKDRDAERPWLVLVGEARLMHSLASPLFAHRVRLVRVNPAQITFSYKAAAPIYYVYEMLEKRALWAAAAQAWTPLQLSRILVDTLYIHMELYTAANRASQLEHVLSGVKCFPLHSDPANKLLPPGHVPLNEYSERKDRSGVLRTKFTSRVKGRDKAVAVLDGLPMVLCRDLLECELSCKGLLFEDLEKPASAWVLLEYGVPYAAVSRLTTWKARDPNWIKKRFAATRPLYVRDLKALVVAQVQELAATMQLDPAWFADWYNGLDAKSLAEEYPDPEERAARAAELRLEAYAVFCASYFWHAYNEKRLRFGANYHYIFSKEACDELFHRGLHLASDVQRLARRLGNEPEAAPPAPIGEGEWALRVATKDALKAMNGAARDAALEMSLEEMGAPAGGLAGAGAAPALQRPVLVDTNSGASFALVHPSLMKRAQSVAKLIAEVTMRWATGKRDGKLAAPFASLPPLLMQSTYTYGPATHAKLDDMYRNLAAAVKTAHGAVTHKVAIVRAGDDPARTFASLKSDIGSLYMLVMDRFHVWNEALTDSVLEVLTSPSIKPSKCTHIFITAHSYSFADTNTSGFLFDDLVDVSHTLNGRIGLEDASSAPETWLHAGQSRFRMAEAPGNASLQMFTAEQREQQLALNAPFVTDEYTFLTALTKFAADHGEKSPILVLFALKQTENAINKVLSDNSGAWGLGRVTLVSYETLARCPSHTAGDRACVVLCDLDYTGAGRPTFLHINAALERCKGVVMVLKTSELPAVTVPARAAAAKRALTAVRAVFMGSDAKSDRLVTRNQRLSILRAAIDRYLKTPQFAALLQAAKDSAGA